MTGAGCVVSGVAPNADWKHGDSGRLPAGEMAIADSNILNQDIVRESALECGPIDGVAKSMALSERDK